MSGTSGLRRHDHTSAGQGGTIASGAPDSADYLVGTANGSLSAEIVVGTTPGGELGGSWASPTVDATHSGSAHHTQSHDHASAGDGTSLSPATLVVPGASSPAQTAEGSAVWDTDDDKLTVGTGAGRKTLVNEGGSLSLLGAPTGDLSIGSHKLTNVTDPTSAQDAATKAYADGLTGAAIAAKDEGSTLTAAVASVDFVGAGVTATNVGSAVTVTIPGGSGSVATDAIFDTKGDLAVGTGADTAAKLAAGANDTILMADSGQSTGLKYVGSQTPSTQAFSDAAAEGTADTYARGDHKHGMPASPSSLSYVQALLGSPVTMTNANQYYDGPSIVLSAGTWLIGGWVAITGSGAGAVGITAKLWNGTTVAGSAEGTTAAASYGIVIPVGPVVIVIASGTPTWKISCATNSAGGSIDATAPHNGAGATESGITAVQIA